MNDTGKSGSDINPQRLSEDSSAPQMDDGAPISSVPNALNEAKAETEKFKNEYLYLRAEFENYKKQVIKERSDLRKYGSERLIGDLLGVLDIFETALATAATPENAANFRKGIEMTATELRNALVKHGVTEIPAHGQAFDPVMHEALSSEESDAAAGTITQVFKKPYKLHDRVIRPGQVVVARARS